MYVDGDGDGVADMEPALVEGVGDTPGLKGAVSGPEVATDDDRVGDADGDDVPEEDPLSLITMRDMMPRKEGLLWCC